MNWNNFFLVTDLDGTLLNDNHQISSQNLEALRFFVQQGGEFTFATGRTRLSVRPYLDKLPITQPIILGNGCRVFDPWEQKDIFEANLPQEILKTALKIHKEHPKVGIQAYRGEDLYIFQSSPYTSDQFDIEEVPMHHCDFKELPPPWMKLIFAGEPEELAELDLYIRKTIEGIEPVLSHKHYLEILPAAASKGKALEFLLNRDPQLNKRKIYTIGDQMNDLPLIKAGNVSAAVANAHPELKQEAHIIVVHNNDHALADFINRMRKGI